MKITETQRKVFSCLTSVIDPIPNVSETGNKSTKLEVDWKTKPKSFLPDVLSSCEV